MIFVLGFLVGAHLFFGVNFTADTTLIALALGMISDSVRSNRVSSKNAAQTLIKGYAEALAAKAGSK